MAQMNWYRCKPTAEQDWRGWVKNSPIGPPPRPSRAGASSSHAGAADGSTARFLERFGCNCCTPFLRQLHPAGVPVAPCPRLGVKLLHPAGPVLHSLAAGDNGVR